MKRKRCPHCGQIMGGGLKSIRNQLGKTLQDIAEEIGCSSRQMVSLWESGAQLPRKNTIPKAAAAYGVSVGEFVEMVLGIEDGSDNE